MKKSNIEIKSARIQKFRLRRSNHGILPEITFCLDRFGVTKHTKQLELFSVHDCDVDFLVDILSMFNAYYPHELAGRTANIVFLNEKPIGLCPLDGDLDSWMICIKDTYERIAHKDLFKVLMAS